MCKMEFGVVSALPELFSNWRNSGVVGRAFKKQLLGWHESNPRNHVQSNYRSIDDTPYGGGPGMVMQLDPLVKALRELTEQMPQARIHLMAPEGRRFSTANIDEWLGQHAHILICGRYEGIDQRFIELFDPQLWSLGDMVLSGGEIAAMGIIEAVARHIPGVLGNSDSADVDSFHHSDGLLDHPDYSRPHTYQGHTVPGVLRSGNHQQIDNWRHARRSCKTWDWRPDLLRGKLHHCDLEAINAEYASRLSKYFQTHKEETKKV